MGVFFCSLQRGDRLFFELTGTRREVMGPGFEWVRKTSAPRASRRGFEQIGHARRLHVSLGDRRGMVDLKPAFFHLGPRAPEVPGVQRDSSIRPVVGSDVRGFAPGFAE